MELNQTLRGYLVQELRAAANGLAGVTPQRLSDGPFYFSAVYAAFGRVMNIEYSREMNFLHSVTNGAHTQIAQRVAAMSQGADQSIGMAADFFPTLGQYVRALADDIERDEFWIDAVMAIAEMAFVTSGNGFYLHVTRGIGRV